RGPYVGFGYGSLDYEESTDIPGVSISDTTDVFKIFGGLQITNHLAVEASWAVTNDIEESFVQTVPMLGDVTIDASADFEIKTVRLLGTLPLTIIGLYAGIGYYDADTDVSVRATTTSGPLDEVSDSGSDDGAMVVAGIEIDLPAIEIRGELEWYDARSG